MAGWILLLLAFKIIAVIWGVYIIKLIFGQIPFLFHCISGISFYLPNLRIVSSSKTRCYVNYINTAAAFVYYCIPFLLRLLQLLVLLFLLCVTVCYCVNKGCCCWGLRWGLWRWHSSNTSFLNRIYLAPLLCTFIQGLLHFQ